MTAKSGYKKELFSLPVDVAETLKRYAEKTHRKKSHIVAEAIEEYVSKADRQKKVEEAKSIIGFAKGSVSDIQEIKAHRYE